MGISNKLKKYLKILNATSCEEIKNISKGDEIFMSITQCIEKFLNDKETEKLFNWETWVRREERYEGVKEGKIAGEKIGLTKGKIQIAKAMLKEKIALDVISRTTGLPKSEIIKLRHKKAL